MASEQPLLGHLLGHYRIVEHIGAGGMGVVYRAHDGQLERDVALKVLPTGMLADESARRRFRREALALAKLNHPNIEAVYEFDSQEGVDFLVMELLSGLSLNIKLAAGALPEREVVSLGIQLADGLEAAHTQGIVHRDLKPGNLRLTKEARLKIMDFGLAQYAPLEGVDAPTVSIAKSEEISGTVPYMAPEQLRGQPADVRSDIYSAGAVLYEMATGKHLFPDTSGPQLIGAILERPPSPPSSHNRRISPALESIILKALDKDPNRRYQSAKELRVDLERLSSGVMPVIARRRRGLLWAAALATALMALLIGLNAGRLRGRWFRGSVAEGPAAAQSRRSVAVLGFKNVSAKPDQAWISTAVAEMLTSELAAGEHVRTIPGENVARMKLDLSLPDADGFSADTLAHIRQHLGSDLVVLGSYVESGGQLRLDSRLQDTVAGETIASVAEQGTETELLDLVSRTGARLRERLGIGAVSARESPGVHAALPSNPAAARFYAEGLAKQRVFEHQAARDLFEKAVAADPSHALAHSALSSAWASLGYDAKSQGEAKKAFDASANLSREDRLLIEGRYRETTHEWPKAMEIYRTLWEFFPDNLDYGLRLASSQSSAGQAKDALVTIEALRKLQGPSGNDPRIDLAEAVAGQWLGDHRREATASARAAEKAKAQGARVLTARARLSEGGALADLGETTKAITALQESRQIYFEVGDRQGFAGALNSLGIIQRHQGNFGESKKLLEQSLETSRQTGNKLGIQLALNNLGNLLSDQGDVTKAQEAYEQSLKLTREIGDKGLEANTLDNIACLLTTQGKLASARQMFEESLRLAREIGDLFNVALTLGDFAHLLNRQGDLASGRKAAEEALAIDREIADKSLSGYALTELGLILAAQGDLAAARSKLEEALALRQQTGEKLTAAESRLALGELLLEEGTPEKAESEARQVSAVFHEEVAVDDEAASHSLLARALLAQGKVSEAQQAAAQAERLLAKAQDPATHLLVQITHARVTAAQNLKVAPGHSSIASAKGNLNTALAEAKKFGYPVFQFEARLALGQIEMKSGSTTAGRARLEALRKDVTAQGFLLIARKAAAAAKASA